MESSKESIRAVFDSFDKDKNGFIEFNEIVKVAQELGQEISPADVQKIFSQIDTNKDNKISFEEFYSWWQYGRDNKLEGLVALQLKALKLLSKAKLLLGSNQEEFSSQILKGLNLGIDVPSIVFRFKSSNPSESKNTLEEIVNNLLEMAKMMIPNEGVQQVLELVKTSFGEDGEYVVFGLSLEHQLLTQIVYQYLEVMSLYLGNDFKGEVETDFGLNFDFNTIFDNKDKKLFDIVGKGFHVNLGVRLSQNLQEKYTNFLSDLVNKWLEKKEEKKISSLVRKYGFLLLLKSFNLEIIAKDLEDLSTKIAGTGLESGIAGIPNTVVGQALELAKEEAPPLSALAAEMPIIQEIVDYFKTVKEEGSITLQVPRAVVHIQLNSNGVDRVLEHFMN